MMNQEKYYELTYYTLAHPDPAFIHQHVVDAYAAQNADQHTKPIGVVFGLIGLYLYLEKNYSGREVQQAHMQLAKKRKQWPAYKLPKNRGDLTAADVMDAPPGPQRDAMIRQWCAAVWQAYSPIHRNIVELVQSELWR